MLEQIKKFCSNLTVFKNIRKFEKFLENVMNSFNAFACLSKIYLL